MQVRIDALKEIARQWQLAKLQVESSSRKIDATWARGRVSAFEDAATALVTERIERNTGTVVIVPPHGEIVRLLTEALR